MTRPLDEPRDLAALRTLSARLGAQITCTQGAGGNTSLKDGNVLWIKASGTWLAQALARPIHVAVDLDAALQALHQGDARASTCAAFVLPANDDATAPLRPSIETIVHAVMAQRVVVHVHCVDTLAHAVRADAPACLAPALATLADLDCRWIPYRQPGLPLAAAIVEAGAQQADVLILANHGLVVAGDSVAAVEDRVARVRQALQLPRRTPHADADIAALAGVAQAAGYRLPDDAQCHALALDDAAVRIAAAGNLYPDHVIFLGPQVAVTSTPHCLDDLGHSNAATLVILPGRGVLLRRDAPPSADLMARCLAEVCLRIPLHVPPVYLHEDDTHALLHWEAERYRQALNAGGTA